MKRSISALLIGGALSLVTAGAAHAQDKTIKIGVLTDDSGLYSDLGGAGSTLAALVQAGVYSGLIHSLRHHNVIEREG